MESGVTLMESGEGVGASCPELRGCHSQGATREEALANIRDAIREMLDAEQLGKAAFNVSEEIVTA